MARWKWFRSGKAVSIAVALAAAVTLGVLGVGCSPAPTATDGGSSSGSSGVASSSTPEEVSNSEAALEDAGGADDGSSFPVSDKVSEAQGSGGAKDADAAGADSSTSTKAAAAQEASAVDYDAIYDGVLRQALAGEGEFAASYDPDEWAENCFYSTYDVGADGVPELFVMTGATTMSSLTHVFTVEAGEAVLLGQYSGLLSCVSAGDDMGGLYTGWMRQGMGTVNRVTFADGEAVETTVASGNVYDDGPNADADTITNYFSENGITEFENLPVISRLSAGSAVEGSQAAQEATPEPAANANPETIDATDGAQVSLTGTLIRKDETTADTLMAWGSATYLLELPEPVSITYDSYGLGREEVTEDISIVHVASVEFSSAVEDERQVYLADHPWEEETEYDAYVGETVTVTGTLADPGNAHVRAACRFASPVIEVI